MLSYFNDNTFTYVRLETYLSSGKKRQQQTTTNNNKLVHFTFLCDTKQLLVLENDFCFYHGASRQTRPTLVMMLMQMYVWSSG